MNYVQKKQSSLICIKEGREENEKNSWRIFKQNDFPLASIIT